MKQLTVDVHGMDLEHFTTYVSNLVQFTPDEVRYICIIHGYRHGTALREFVRTKFNDKRLLSVNGYEEGRTIIKLKH